MTPCESFLLAKNGSSKLKQLALITLLLLEYIYIYICVCVCVCVCACVCVLTINGGVDISDLPSFASIRHRNAIIFDTRKTLYHKEPPAELLKTCLKDICFVVI